MTVFPRKNLFNLTGFFEAFLYSVAKHGFKISTMYSKLFNDECGPSIAGLKNGLDPSWAAPGKYMCMCVWVVCVCVCGVCVYCLVGI